ncbi:MAG TPA: DUF3187 family protein [Thermoanaerobaculia bacterium]|jgi:hypothetical protein|nr:DUF3187 family protein [Thermoanaerobaculia bacterium]
MKFQHKLSVAAAIALAVSALAGSPAQAQAELMGPLRIRDMTPFNILRLDMIPAHAVTGGPGSWAIEAEISRANTFVMSDNVGAYLERRPTHGPLRQSDAEAILDLGEDSYYVDGEVTELDLTFHYGLTRRSSVYLTLPAYDFGGGFLDGTVERFHDAFGFDSQGRDLVARDRFQAVVALGNGRAAFLEPPVATGVGDPVVGVRHSWPLRNSHWTLVADGAAKLALRGERPFLSTGSNDFGLQTSLQGKFRRQGIYLSTSVVRTDGRVLGVPIGSRVVPTVTAAYEVGVTRQTNVILQLYASESAIRDTSIDQIKENKYQASLGLRSRRGRLLYGIAVTENVANFENTPDVGVSLTLAWLSLRP